MTTVKSAPGRVRASARSKEGDEGYMRSALKRTCQSRSRVVSSLCIVRRFRSGWEKWMASRDLVERLREHPSQWNAWRAALDETVRLDLTFADLAELDL